MAGGAKSNVSAGILKNLRSYNNVHVIYIQYLSINIFDDTHTNSGNLCAAGRAFASNHTFRMKDGSGRVNPTLQLRTNAHSMFQFDSISLPSAFSSSSMEVMTYI